MRPSWTGLQQSRELKTLCALFTLDRKENGSGNASRQVRYAQGGEHFAGRQRHERERGAALPENRRSAEPTGVLEERWPRCSDPERDREREGRRACLDRLGHLVPGLRGVGLPAELDLVQRHHLRGGELLLRGELHGLRPQGVRDLGGQGQGGRRAAVGRDAAFALHGVRDFFALQQRSE